MKKKLKVLARFLRKLNKPLYKKWKKVKDGEEQIETAKYAIKVSLENQYYDLKKRVDSIDENVPEKFLLESKLAILLNWIKFFLVSFHESDFEKIEELIRSMEKSLAKLRLRKNVKFI